MKSMQEPWDEDEDDASWRALFSPDRCPRCNELAYSFDLEFSAYCCEHCGLWVEVNSAPFEGAEPT